MKLLTIIKYHILTTISYLTIIVIAITSNSENYTKLQVLKNNINALHWILHKIAIFVYIAKKKSSEHSS